MNRLPHGPQDLQRRKWNAALRPLRYLVIVALSVVTGAALGQSAGEISLYGGPDNRQYLGCWSCSDSHPNSIFNEYGVYGNRYGTNSIWNPYSQFGSDYASYSVCNPYARMAPILMDSRGGFYGHLTVNPYHAQRVTDTDIIRWLQTVVCGRP